MFAAGGSKKRGDIAKISLSEEEYDFRIEVDKVKKWSEIRMITRSHKAPTVGSVV